MFRHTPSTMILFSGFGCVLNVIDVFFAFPIVFVIVVVEDVLVKFITGLRV